MGRGDVLTDGLCANPKIVMRKKKSRAAANRVRICGISASNCTQAVNQLLQRLSPVAIFHDHLLHFLADSRKFKAVAKALAGADYGNYLRFRGRIWEREFQAHRGANGNGAGNICADAATAEAPKAEFSDLQPALDELLAAGALVGLVRKVPERGRVSTVVRAAAVRDGSEVDVEFIE